MVRLCSALTLSLSNGFMLNMKRLILAVAVLAFLRFPFVEEVYASTPTPTTPPASVSQTTKLENQINQLKERVASRVAELKLVEKRGIIIKVTEVTNAQIKGEDLAGNTRFVDVDEFTKFSSSTIKSFGISDIKSGDSLGVLGLYNKNSSRILARFVNTATFQKYFFATASKIDKVNFSITIVSVNNTSTNVDIENTTKTLSFTKDGGLTRSGFSKIIPGQRVVVLGYPDKTKKDTIVASKIILLLDIPLNPSFALPDQTATPISTKSSKITPIK